MDVQSDDSCGCPSAGAGGTPLLPTLDPKTGIVVRSKPGITNGNTINAYIEGGKQIYELDDLVLVSPIISLGTDAAVTEVGNTVTTAVFTGTIAAGTYPIATRNLSPGESVNLNISPFTFSKSNVKRTTPGLGQSHTLTVVDDHSNQSIVIGGVVFKHAFYRGFASLASIDQATIKAMTKTLVDDIRNSYGGLHDYVVPGSPAGPKYIYFAGPVGTSPPVGATLNGLPLPLTDPGNVTITNIYDGSLLIEYWVRRTSARFDSGTYPIILS